ncbi:hypothetical protein [Rubrimonas cliftonensis]|uniref:Uncharacterized protein n=1 Tax=Rubrimonas cliftonensis TaxID=89524 RepID=A0A1H4ENY0_9RHOB|nr:hypothetical protein [Rubrimonas cliftonensis]SEA86765.1 hypothetical protein SAMN05444370_11517 [Rubrimonas cliftonensis]
MTPRTAVFAALFAALTPLAAAAGSARYVVAWWDGADNPGVWFRAEGAVVPAGVALTRVDDLPPGLVVRPDPGRLHLSRDLALLLDVAPRTPTLLRVAAPSEAPLEAARAPVVPARTSPTPGEPAPATAQTLASRQERIAALLAALQAEAAASAEEDAAAMAAAPAFDPGAPVQPHQAAAAPVARGRLVPFMPGDLP